jgi:hypothetical protein
MVNLFTGSFLLWVVNIAYCLSLVPQLLLNHKIKSTRGLSDLYLLGYFSGYFLNIFYVYILNFNFAYKALAPFSFFIVTFMIFQRFLYKDYFNPRVYVGTLLLLGTFAWFAFANPLRAGHLAGWILVGIWSLYQLPQVITIFSRKSVEGFSLLLVSLIGCGNVIEFVMSVLLQFPLQSVLIAFRGIVFFLIFGLQFWLYSKK